jgi:hypothetical protein
MFYYWVAWAREYKIGWEWFNVELRWRSCTSFQSTRSASCDLVIRSHHVGSSTSHIPQVPHNRSSHKLSADIKLGQPDKLWTSYKITWVNNIGTNHQENTSAYKSKPNRIKRRDQCLIFPQQDKPILHLVDYITNIKTSDSTVKKERLIPTKSSPNPASNSKLQTAHNWVDPK